MLKSADNELVKKAIDFATLSMSGKVRHSGESFVDHCVKVAEILENFDINDPKVLCVAILHHSLAHGAATAADIEKEFGLEITVMLQTLDSLRVVKIGESDREEFAENIRKMILAMAKDLRIVLIKMADIFDNLQTIEYLSESKKKELARETLEIFAPLAERLGMGEMRSQMQDLAFAALFPDEFKKTKNLLKENIDVLEKELLKIKIKLKEALDDEGIPFRLESRAKHIYSLYQKLKRPEINFDISQVYDLIAFRIIVNSTEDCYKVLGLIHKNWQPVPDKIKDYIASPKPNGYQSLHTTVFGFSNRPFEIQIRTEQMHQDAEFGVAAHWHYSQIKEKGVSKEEINRKAASLDTKLKWVQNLSRWQEEITDDEEFLKSIKTDFLGQRIFVFTPKGDVKDLPSGATPVDFAYSVHSDLGNFTIGAKVNNKMVSLDTRLKNSDVCEIILSKDKNHKPNRDWLKFVGTANARRRIRKAYLD